MRYLITTIIGVLIILSATNLPSSQTRLRYTQPVEIDSARTVTDHSLTSRHFDPTKPLTISATAFRIIADTLLFSGPWIGWATIPELGTIDSIFVYCPIVGDSTNTAVFYMPYCPYRAKNISPSVYAIYTQRFYPDSGFVARVYNVGSGAYLNKLDFGYLVIRWE